MPQVVLKDPESMNLMGLFLKTILERNMENASKAAVIQNMRATIDVKGGKMGVSLIIDRGTITIERGSPQRSNSRIAGTLDSMLSICTGGSYVAPVLSGKVKIGGNPFLLLRLLSLLRVPATEVVIRN